MVSAKNALTAMVVAGALAVVCSGCSSSPHAVAYTANPADAADRNGDAAREGDGGLSMNVAPVVVDHGPSGVDAVNTLYTSLTLCRPGTTICQTVDHVEVDTGSTGIRIVASVLDPTLMLPQQIAADGNPLVECYQYVDGYNWGSVAAADVQIGGEMAKAVPIQIVGGPEFRVIPSDCSSVGGEEDTVMTFGGNGLIGIGFNQADCGSTCASTASPRAAAYYSCTSTACAVASVPIANQLQNPVGLFPTDNNGVAVQLPAIDPAGAATVTGSLIFGIGTALNNGLGAAQIIPISPLTGYFTTVYGGRNLTASFIDTGSLSYAFADTTVPQCVGNLSGFFCPATSLGLMATNRGKNGVAIATPFSVASADGLYASVNAAFDDLAITAFASGYFDWGLPFFYGRTVFTAISGATTPSGAGPYFAY
jgi:hypothetical protein